MRYKIIPPDLIQINLLETWVHGEREKEYCIQKNKNLFNIHVVLIYIKFFKKFTV